MRILVAPDEFEGSLSAPQVAVPDAVVVEIPVADGGEGTLEAAVAVGFQRVRIDVAGPTGEPLVADLGVRDATAVVEMAAASGLAVLPSGRPSRSSTTSPTSTGRSGRPVRCSSGSPGASAAGSSPSSRGAAYGSGSGGRR